MAGLSQDLNVKGSGDLAGHGASVPHILTCCKDQPLNFEIRGVSFFFSVIEEPRPCLRCELSCPACLDWTRLLRFYIAQRLITSRDVITSEEQEKRRDGNDNNRDSTKTFFIVEGLSHPKIIEIKRPIFRQGQADYETVFTAMARPLIVQGNTHNIKPTVT